MELVRGFGQGLGFGLGVAVVGLVALAGIGLATQRAFRGLRDDFTTGVKRWTDGEDPGTKRF